VPTAISELVSTGVADVGIGPRPSHWDGRTEVIGREEIVAALAVADGDAPLTLADIAAEPVVHYHPDNGLGAWLDDLAATNGFTLTAATRTRQASTAAQLAAAGLGTALVPTTALTATFPGAVRSLHPPVFRDVVCLTTAPNDPLVQQFQSEVRRRGVPVPAAIATQLTPHR
ncbi:LysR substrate-binding domain-containing protein, partial [Nocardia tenerifensis]|uniref:LysR substrate-binding domain-containing protein n=1 Tax=Nocardia tenerifensis TaxID=228006 RepID=UPI0005944BEA